MATVTSPQFHELTTQECHALLTSNNVGRLAFTMHDRVDIQPINYVSDGEWIFGRTSEGAKLATLLHNPWCAFETDVVHDLFDWSSVVVKGTFTILEPTIGSVHSLHTYQRAEMLLRKLVPGAFSTHDPVPHRTIIFGIFCREITGRGSRT